MSARDEIRALVEKHELGFMRNLGGGEFKGKAPVYLSLPGTALLRFGGPGDSSRGAPRVQEPGA